MLNASHTDGRKKEECIKKNPEETRLSVHPQTVMQV